MSPPTILLDEDELAATVTELGAQVARDHPDGVLLVGVLQGALFLLADLARAVPDVEVLVDFVAISRFAPDSGRVRITQDLALDVGGRDVVLVEDVVDTGLTLSYLRRTLAARGPRRLRVCALLDRPARRIVPERVDYRGRELGDEYVLGYGLHHHDLYRNVPAVAAVDRQALLDDPRRYVHDLYGRPRAPEGPVVGLPAEEGGPTA